MTGRHTLTIADLMSDDVAPLIEAIAFSRNILKIGDSTHFDLVKSGRFPIETVRVARKRYVRTSDVRAWLRLPQNDEAARGPALTAPAENAPVPTSHNQQDGARGVQTPNAAGK